ncbi:hypothetical protein MKX01_036069 [Papaver californicum]|nr:hypothetical protein MKX01_036069 [Papaver californicum]
MRPPPQRQQASLAGTRSTAGSSASPSSQPSSSATPSSQPSSLIKKPRVGVKKSWVWNHFDIIEDGAKAKCKHCPKGRGSYKIGGKTHGTTNLSHHLEKCIEYKKSVNKEQGGQQTLGFQPCKSGEEPQLVGVSFSQEGCRKALIRFIITDEMAF